MPFSPEKGDLWGWVMLLAQLHAKLNNMDYQTDRTSVQTVGDVVIHDGHGRSTRPIGSVRQLLELLVRSGPQGCTPEEIAWEFWRDDRPAHWRSLVSRGAGLLEYRLPTDWKVHVTKTRILLDPGTGHVDAWHAPQPISDDTVTYQRGLVSNQPMAVSPETEDPHSYVLVGAEDLMLPLGPYQLTFPDVRAMASDRTDLFETGSDLIKDACDLVAATLDRDAAPKQVIFEEAHLFDKLSLDLTTSVVRRLDATVPMLITANSQAQNLHWRKFAYSLEDAGFVLAA